MFSGNFGGDFVTVLAVLLGSVTKGQSDYSKLIRYGTNDLVKLERLAPVKKSGGNKFLL